MAQTGSGSVCALQDHCVPSPLQAGRHLLRAPSAHEKRCWSSPIQGCNTAPSSLHPFQSQCFPLPVYPGSLFLCAPYILLH